MVLSLQCLAWSVVDVSINKKKAHAGLIFLSSKNGKATLKVYTDLLLLTQTCVSVMDKGIFSFGCSIYLVLSRPSPPHLSDFDMASL